MNEVSEEAIRVAASLAAAISLLEEASRKRVAPQKVVASDTMFNMMLEDYKKALNDFRQRM